MPETDPAFSANALRKWADFEMECLWDELRRAHRLVQTPTGAGRVWTVGCEGIAERIRTLSAIIGPVSWRRVPISGIADGWFVQMCEKLSIAGADLPDEDEVAYAQMWVQRQIDAAR